MDVQRADDLEPEHRRQFNLLRARVAEQGYELTPDELLSVYRETMDTLDTALAEQGFGENAFTNNFSQWQFLSEIPPLPPYICLFDHRCEAENFAERAKAYHEVDCVIEETGIASLCEYRTYFLLTDLETHIHEDRRSESETAPQEEEESDPT